MVMLVPNGRLQVSSHETIVDQRLESPVSCRMSAVQNIKIYLENS